MQILYVNYIPGSNTPAKVYRKSGLIIVNRSRFDHLPEFTKKFILKHEEGHHILNTTDEFLADEYASKALLLTEPGSLKNSIKALNDVLPKKTKEQNLRITAQIKRALKADADKGNKEAKQALKNLIEMESNYEGSPMYQKESYSQNIFFPTIGKSFNDYTNLSFDKDAFILKTQNQALGFEKTVPETFVKTLEASNNSKLDFEKGSLGEKLPKMQPTENSLIEDITPGENLENSISEMPVRKSDPLFFFLLGIITVLLIALIANLFKK